MASCNYNELLVDGRCFAALPLAIQGAIELQLWCSISGAAISPEAISNPDIPALVLNPDNPSNVFNPDV